MGIYPKRETRCQSGFHNSVPRKGFEPSHGFPRCDLNTVRLPISPPGHLTARSVLRKPQFLSFGGANIGKDKVAAQKE